MEQRGLFYIRFMDNILVLALTRCYTHSLAMSPNPKLP